MNRKEKRWNREAEGKRRWAWIALVGVVVLTGMVPVALIAGWVLR